MCNGGDVTLKYDLVCIDDVSDLSNFLEQSPSPYPEELLELVWNYFFDRSSSFVIFP